MKFVIGVDSEKFDQFAISSKINHYSKTSIFRNINPKEYQSSDLLGVEDDEGKLIATALMLHRKTSIPGVKFSYIQYGFNLDINDKELIKFFSENLINFAKSKGSCFLRMDSNITRIEHYKNGKIKEDGFNHEYITELLEQSGFKHLGYNYGYSGNWMSRFTYRIDLDKPWKEVKKGIKRYTNYTNRNELRDVKVRKGTRDELIYLIDAQEELSQKLGFKPKDIKYFQRLWDYYGDCVHYYIVSTNFHVAIKNLKKELQIQKERLNILSDEEKIRKANINIEALNSEINELIQSGLDVDKEVFLGAKFIIKQGVDVWNVNMYTKKTLNDFRAAFALHTFAIEDLYNQGAKTYDFEGISGSLDPKDEYHGQQEFKRSFGGDFLEFLGEFDAVFDENKYKTWKKLRSLKSRARRKIRYYLYRKK